ncbi:MAG TPA: carbon starvation CstA family protein [Bacteroidales bacterium]|nr:carbon starvation CstA family protein [Bacteroidales bacterium]
MYTFVLSIGLLILGYFFYGKFIEKFFGADNSKKTPAYTKTDGIDYIPMPAWKIFMIQFLNIAGLGPIFGAILGAQYGPMAYVWIVFGCIFMGAVHDYFSGMLSIRNDGESLPELVGRYLGISVQQILRIFTIALLIFVGVAFVTGPAGLLSSLTNGGKTMWLYIIFAYYLIATLLPINKIIGKIYPIFGIALIFMAVSIATIMIYKGLTGGLNLVEISANSFTNFHHNPEQNLLYPMMFIVISCGAISGFHSTQSPMMARCLKNEKQGKKIFYGAMIAEGIVAIIWATAAMNFFGNVDGLNNTLLDNNNNAAFVVDEICRTWLGKTGAIFAIIGVIALPISTGDTAFRSARLTIADIFSFKQKSIKSRLIVSIPLFVAGFILSQLDFATVWKFLGLSNQILASFVLWTGAMYLIKNKKPHWYLSIPAFIMTTICFTYFLVAPNSVGGLAINVNTGYILGLSLSIAIATLWSLKAYKR